MAPPGYTDNTGATDFDDTINSGGGGSDIIHAGDGDDRINFLSDLDATDQVDGGPGDDRLAINDRTFVTFGVKWTMGSRSGKHGKVVFPLKDYPRRRKPNRGNSFL